MVGYASVPPDPVLNVPLLVAFVVLVAKKVEVVGVLMMGTRVPLTNCLVPGDKNASRGMSQSLVDAYG